MSFEFRAFFFTVFLDVSVFSVFSVFQFFSMLLVKLIRFEELIESVGD